MAMRLGLSCHMFPTVRSRLCLQRPCFHFSVNRHPRRYILHSSGRLRCLTSPRCRRFAVSAASVVDEEGNGFGEFSEPKSWRERNGGGNRNLDADNTGTSGRPASEGHKGRRVSARADYQRADWMQGWDDGQSVDTRNTAFAQGEDWDGDRRTRRFDTSSNGVHERKGPLGGGFKRVDAGSDADARRDAFARFLRRDSRLETEGPETSSSLEWGTGFHPKDGRTARTAQRSNSPWARLSQTLSDVPAQVSEVGRETKFSTSFLDSPAPPSDKPLGPLPPLSKFFPDSIVNPFSNPPQGSNSGGFFSQERRDNELAATGRKLAEDLWGKGNETRSSPHGATRFASKSVGSRSAPSKSSIPGRFSKYSKKATANRQFFSTSAPVAEDSFVSSPSSPRFSEPATEASTAGAAVLHIPVLSADRQADGASSSPSEFITRNFEGGKDSHGSLDDQEPVSNVFGSNSTSVPVDSVVGPSSSPSPPPDRPLDKPSVDPISSAKVQTPPIAPRLSSAGGAVIESFPSPVASSLPFEFQYSYSEVPKEAPVRLRNKFSPFGPQTMGRPWTGKAPLKKSKKNLPAFDSFKPPPANKKGVKYVQQPGPFPPGQGPKPAKSREEILGEPLTKEEIAELVGSCIKEQRQLNLGRDGLTHNMLDLIHSHWKRRRCLRVKCKGVPTVDMDNVCFHLEDKTGGVIIHRAGGTVYLYRGRYYNYKDRPQIPLMLWKPLAPFYPRLVKPVPDGMTKQEVDDMRRKGKKIEALKKLNKNGVYLNLVQEVRDGFLFDDIVKLDCKGLNPSDYKKIGAKLKELVPCVLLSFEKEQILMWKGRNLGEIESAKHPVADGGAESDEDEDVDDGPLENANESSAQVHDDGQTMEDMSDHDIAGGAQSDEEFERGCDVGYALKTPVDVAEADEERAMEASQNESSSLVEAGAGSEIPTAEPSSRRVNTKEEIQQNLPSSVASTIYGDRSVDKADQLGDHEFPNYATSSHTGPIPDLNVLVAEDSSDGARPGNGVKREEVLLPAATPKLEEERSAQQRAMKMKQTSNLLDDLWNQAIDSGDAVALNQPEFVDLDILKEKVKTLSSIERVQESARATLTNADGKRKGQKKPKSDDFSTTPDDLPVDELAKFLSPNRSSSNHQ